MDKYRISQIISFVEFLKNVVGKNVEIVFHVISKEKSYVAAIVNGHVSGRDTSAPLTDLALSLIDSGLYKTRKYIKNYTGYTKDNKKIMASTYFLTSKEGELEGMICFNVDVSKYDELVSNLIENLNVGLDFLESINPDANNEINHDNMEFTEYYSHSIMDTVYSAVPKEVLDSGRKLRTNQKMDIIRAVYAKGFFNIKGTIPEISKIIDSSVSSVYRYIAEVEKENA